jgi:hypothetical protein
MPTLSWSRGTYEQVTRTPRVQSIPLCFQSAEVLRLPVDEDLSRLDLGLVI